MFFMFLLNITVNNNIISSVIKVYYSENVIADDEGFWSKSINL